METYFLLRKSRTEHFGGPYFCSEQQTDIPTLRDLNSDFGDRPPGAFLPGDG